MDDVNIANDSGRIIDKKISWIKILAVFLVLLACAILGTMLYFRHAINNPLLRSSQAREFVIFPGQKARDIGDSLYKHGLIGSAWVFNSYAWLTGNAGKMQAGVYEVSSKMTIKQMLAKFSTGAVKNTTLVIRIKEGWTIEDIGEYLEQNKIISKSDFINAEKQATESYSYFGEKTAATKSLQGYLFPDTYFLDKRAISAHELITKMLENTERKISAEIKQEIKSKNLTIHEALTIASIIEREVGRNTSRINKEDRDRLELERGLVSGIFHNRLKMGMPLQSDATVQFITKKRNPIASLEDIQIDSPYNTYKYAGLPPGPIANPSLASILAAIRPTQTEYLYFLNKPDGTAVFAKTLEEQLRNKRLYLK